MKLIIAITIFILISGNFYSQKAFNNIDVEKYKIVLDFTEMENSELKGYTEVKLFSLVENLNVINLDLLNLTIDSITCPLQDLDYTYNDDIINIWLQESLNTGDPIIFNIYYHGKPVVEESGFGGFYFMNEYAFNMGIAIDDIPHNYARTWFPCNDNFTDKAIFHFLITTNEEHTAVCNGELLNTTHDEENHTKTYEWTLNNNIPPYLASIAVGPYFCYTSEYEGIQNNIPISVYVYPGDSARAAGSFKNIKNALSIFESKFGEYKWNRVGYVGVPFNGGAMEHATNISIGRDFINGNLSYEDLLYHELAHHWFGDLITCSTAEDMWINEGWATYCETIFREFQYGRENALNYRRASHLKVLKDYNVQDGGFLPLYPMELSNTYSSTIYQKGASVAHALRGYLGDEIFFQAITEFLDRNSYSDVSSYQFRDFITEYTGIDMTDFFNDWVFSGGFVHYSIDSTKSISNGNDYDATVYMKQKLRGKTEYANSNRVEISFIREDLSDTTVLMTFDGESGVQTFTIPFNPVLILCDYNQVISDATTDITKIFTSTIGNLVLANTYSKITVKSVDENEPALVRVTHNFVAPDPIITEIPGLIIANHRYWTIEGNFPESFNAEFSFIYDGASDSNLDNNFFTNRLDSLVLLYRPNRAADWSISSAKNSTAWKNFFIETLIPGEYALAIYDWQQYINISNSKAENEILVYPNPNNGNFYIEINKNFQGELELYSASGQKVYHKKLKKINNPIEIRTEQLPHGLYFLKFINSKTKEINNKKIIIQN